jgi:IclR family transcriptional regulator, acetate operon repressor
MSSTQPRRTSPRPTATRPSPILVLGKAGAVMDAFTPAEPALTAREVQQRTGLPATTTLRLLYTMVEEGFLDRRGDQYLPGLATLRWATIARQGLDLVRLAQPVLEELRDTTDESAYLYVRHGRHSVCVAVAESRHAVQQVLRVGEVLPLHAGSAARVFLAFDPRALEALAAAELPALTSRTITDLDRLTEVAAETRHAGYAASFEERSLGAVSLSAPVFDDLGALAAVLGVAAPRQRFSSDRVPVLAAPVMQAARQLSTRLGHCPTVEPVTPHLPKDVGTTP